jgi:predicted secreted Zn-dependent protease
MRKQLTLLLIIAVCTAAKTQGPTGKSMLEWNEFYTLSWEDFKGKPTEESIGDAGTAVRIKAKPYYVDNKLKYNVNAYFNRDKSWATDRSPELLKHEQLHFDIAELYARKIRKRISDLSSEGVKDIDTYNAEIRALLDESNERDRQYDAETLHGAISKKQVHWEQMVKEELQALNKYKKKKKIISVGS